MTTERAVMVGTGDDGEVGGGSWTKFEKKGGGGRQYRRALQKIRLEPLCQIFN